MGFRAAQVFRLCVARQPNDKELKMITDFYNAQLKRLEEKQLDAKKLAMADAHKSGKDAIELAAWTTVARTILNLDETVTKE